MDERLLEWLNSNKNQSFTSPRRTIFKTRAQEFKIIEVTEEKEIVKIEFSKQKTVLPLGFWRFETALEILERNKGQWIRLGTGFYADDPDTIEYELQEKAKTVYPYRRVDLKSAPHVCDILVLSGIAEYGRAVNPYTTRENQAVKLAR